MITDKDKYIITHDYEAGLYYLCTRSRVLVHTRTAQTMVDWIAIHLPGEIVYWNLIQPE